MNKTTDSSSYFPAWSGKIGDFEVNVINIGDITLPMGESLSGPKGTSDEIHVRTAIAHEKIVPMQDLLVRMNDMVVLVDAGSYDIGPESIYAIPGYQPPLSLTDQMTQLGVSPGDVDHVIITHRHWDHFNGVTVSENGEWIPAFPNAKHYISGLDWYYIKQTMQNKGTHEANAFPILEQLGLLQVIEGEFDVAPGISIHPAAGETEGHQIVRFHSKGETLYSVGDLYHHPIEVAYGQWLASWANRQQTKESREWLLGRAASESACLMASHIPGIGRILQTPHGFKWGYVETTSDSHFSL
ncbi:MBL fold metallo-hydrolase [Paenibacillus sp. NPDC057934]|uniref:MBL fold metallo-hydrolase n=1 Tax=Paenibacillus sp. NPDC057934 TaxID=3346282 RepID=UPI0036DB4985